MCKVAIEYPKELCEHIKVTGTQCDLLSGAVPDDESYMYEVVLWMKDPNPDDQKHDFMRLPLLRRLEKCPLWGIGPSEKMPKPTCKGDGGDGPDVGPCSENWTLKVYLFPKKGHWEAKTLRELRLEKEWKFTFWSEF
jgi:hypothetical protein